MTAHHAEHATPTAAGHSADHHAADHGHGGSHANYFAVFIGLCVFTVISVVVDLLGGGAKGNIIIIGAVLAVATMKALLVMQYFMHLKFEGPWKYVLLAPTAVLGVFLIVALVPDIGLHYYTVQNPQSIEAERVAAEIAANPEAAKKPHGGGH